MIFFISLGQFHLTLNIASKRENLEYPSEQNPNQKQPSLLQNYSIDSRAIGTVYGWTPEGIGHKYETGYDLGVKHRWMSRICKKYD